MISPEPTSNAAKMAAWLAVALVEGDRCRFWQAATKSWASENSTVMSLPAFDIKKVFACIDKHNIACSLVSISGPSDEPLHFHTSHVVGVVTRGAGTLKHRVQDETETIFSNVREGDVIFIPTRILHLFETEQGGLIEYIAFEISDQAIDYQKHWREEQLEAVH